MSKVFSEYFGVIEKKKVLAIDFDSQCNFSKSFLKMDKDPSAPEGVMPPIHHDFDEDDPDYKGWDGRSSIADIFFGAPFGIIPYQTYIKNIDIIPGHAHKLLEAEAVRKAEVVEKIHNQLAVFLSHPDVRNEYDIVIIDTAPSKGPLTIAAMKAATHIIIPSQMEDYSIEGIYGMMQLWMQESLRRPNSNPINLVGILPNMVRNISLHTGMYNSLKSNPSVAKFLMPMKLHLRAVFGEVDVEGSMPKKCF